MLLAAIALLRNRAEGRNHVVRADQERGHVRVTGANIVEALQHVPGQIAVDSGIDKLPTRCRILLRKSSNPIRTALSPRDAVADARNKRLGPGVRPLRWNWDGVGALAMRVPFDVVIFGRVVPEWMLPFELPSSMEAVYKQKSDVPHDSENPLFPFGYGLHY